MKIICISGKGRHGKDTSAEYIKPILERKGYKVLITHYGDLVKYTCKTFFGWDGVKDEKGRHILQYVGTDIIRNQDQNFWVDYIVDILSFFKNEWDYVLIPDCRFPNEIEKLKEKGFDVCSLRVNRINFKSDLTEEQLAHISETALDNYHFDYVVFNDKLDDFYNKLSLLVNDIVTK